MDSEFSLGLMEGNMKDSGSSENKMEKVISIFLMEA